MVSPGISVFSTNKTARHDITEILLKVALNTKISKCGDLIFIGLIRFHARETILYSFMRYGVLILIMCYELM